MVLSILAKIGIGAAIYIVMLLFIAFTTRDVQTVNGCDGSIKTGNTARMYIRSVTFLIAEVDAYLIIIKELPKLKTIGISLLAYPLAMLLAVLISKKGKKADEWKDDYGCFKLFLIILLAMSVFGVYFMTALGWL